MTRHSRLLTAFAAAALATTLLAGCAGGAAPTPTGTGDAGPSTTPTNAQPDPSPTATTAPATATCESLITSDVLAELKEKGWTSQESPFSAGGITLDEGLQCMWADFSVASGNLLIFGWAPITADDAINMQAGLESEGWLREEADGTVYITEDPMQAPTTDENGYGMTYQFGDGWALVADVKQNLLLIQRPGA
ncbi:MAG: nitrate ABC transporter substrate-binding protein [Microbacterium sp.]|nr:MAG: nitrate ABC transporter substrate-binding protein [Microbacterium sp.]